jgi:hypothetical protein
MSCPVGWTFDSSQLPYCKWAGTNPATPPPCGSHAPWDLTNPAAVTQANIWAKQCGVTDWPDACASNPDSYCQGQTGDASSYCRDNQGQGQTGDASSYCRDKQGTFICHGENPISCCAAANPYVPHGPPVTPPPTPGPPCNGNDRAGPAGCTCTTNDPFPLGGPIQCPQGDYCCDINGEAECCSG